MTPAQFVQYIRDTHNLLIGEKSAEKFLIMVALRSPSELGDMDFVAIRGRSRITLLPTGIEITYRELRQAIAHIQAKDQ